MRLQDTEMTDKGQYKLVAKSETGETQSQAVQLMEEQVRIAALALSTISTVSTLFCFVFFLDSSYFWMPYTVTPVIHTMICMLISFTSLCTPRDVILI